MKNLILFAGLLLADLSFAQDTIIVQTFTYDTISTRRAIFSFPPELQSMQFEKVLMYYNLKCSPLTTWDSYDCGEWDYLTYSQIWQHTGVLDSVIKETSRYLINGDDPASIEYVTSPYYHYYEDYQTFITYSSGTDNDFTIGSGTDLSVYPFGADNAVQRTQILWTSSEISGALITAGEIAKLRFDVNALGSSMGHLKIRMKHTSATDLTQFDETGWTTVYDNNTSFMTTGINTINLTYPFNYDGTSSILVDISFENNEPLAAANVLNATATSNNSVVYSNERLGYLNIAPGEYAEVDLTDFDFQDEVTICFWANGDMNFLPANTSVVEGYDSLNHRIVNIHFPWSDQTIYWDAGQGGPYDRIQKLASATEYEDVWHHWAFTKNSTTGTMNIYKDGVLWHTGSAKNLEPGAVNKFRIGNSVGGDYFYGGKLDEFRIWNAEISPTEIAAWMNKKVDPSHPDYADLVLYYDFDNDASIIDKSGNNRDAMMTTPSMINFYSGSQTGHTVSMVRPNVTFVQGTYTSQLDSVLVTDSVLVAPVDILEYQVDGRKFTIAGIDHLWPVGYSYTYDANGNKTDSTWHGADVTLSNETIAYYEEPFEVIVPFEIGRYITPYGIGFSLGPNGKTYVYDVTDYQSMLLGDVDFSAHNTQELIDVKFVFIEGTPPRDVLSVQQLWNGLGSYSYYGLDNDLNLSAETVPMDPDGDMFKLRTRITGHGQVGSNACCEWGNGVGRNHEILVDGTSRFLWEIWRENDCGDNPLISQGGTWPYAREGWCPGDAVPEYEFDLTPFVTPGTDAVIDYEIEDIPVSDPAQGGGNYVISMHVVTYGAPNFANDAAIVDVLNPNDFDLYSKWNPTCQYPRIILKNTGSATLTTAELNIWIGEFGNNVVTYTWNGSLDFLEQEIVEIPVDPSWWMDHLSATTFTARVYTANGVTDDYANNNMYTVNFEPSPSINEPFYIWYKTNNKASENSLYLKDNDGNIIYSRVSGTTTNATEYKDTMYLPAGCYTVEITDSDHDGLGFWYSNQVEGETSGFLRLKDVGGPTIYTFDIDFGHYAKYSFSVGYTVGMEEAESAHRFTIYPNPSKGMFTIGLDNFTGDQLQVEIYNELGAIVYSEIIPDNNPEGYLEKQISLERVPDGIYLVKVVSDDVIHTERVIIQ
jgi:hypothetical protein